MQTFILVDETSPETVKSSNVKQDESFDRVSPMICYALAWLSFVLHCFDTDENCESWNGRHLSVHILVDGLS